MVPDDPHAIVTPEHGFAGATLDRGQLAALAVQHIEWPLPDGARPCARAGPDRRCARQAGAARRRHRAAAGRVRGASRAAGTAGRVQHERVRRDAARPAVAGRRSEAGLRRRDHRRRVATGSSTAYYLATRHGITNVCVLDASYIGSGQPRPQHDDHPQQLRHPRDRCASTSTAWRCTRQLEDETGCWIMHSTKGQIWMAHSVTAARTEQTRALMNAGVRREDRLHPARRDQGGSARRSTSPAAAATRCRAPATTTRARRPVTIASCGRTRRARCARGCTSSNTRRSPGW